MYKYKPLIISQSMHTDLSLWHLMAQEGINLHDNYKLADVESLMRVFDWRNAVGIHSIKTNKLLCNKLFVLATPDPRF